MVATNFPMWTKGDRKNPRFIYGAERDGRFDDTVEYEQDGRSALSFTKTRASGQLAVSEGL